MWESRSLSGFVVCLDRPPPWTADYWTGFSLATQFYCADPFVGARSTIVCPCTLQPLLTTLGLCQSPYLLRNSGCSLRGTGLLWVWGIRPWTPGDELPSLTSTSMSLHVRRGPNHELLTSGLDKLSSTFSYNITKMVWMLLKHLTLVLSYLSWTVGSDLFSLPPSPFFITSSWCICGKSIFPALGKKL